MTGGFQLPDQPTDASPGSEEKIAILEARAKAGLALHHPGDIQLRGDRGRRKDPCRLFLEGRQAS